MGLLNKALSKMNDKTLVRSTPEELKAFICGKFIEGSDTEYLKKLKTAVKAGFFGGQRILKSPSGNQVLNVYGNYFWTINIFGRDVTVTDEETKTFYELPFFKYKKFRKEVLAELKKKGI